MMSCSGERHREHHKEEGIDGKLAEGQSVIREIK